MNKQIPQQKYILEYIWLGGHYELRSKIKIFVTDKPVNNISNLPHWNFDGSSTGQATGEDSEVNLLPVAMYKNPLRYANPKFIRNSTINYSSYLVLCETRDKNDQPLATNHRYQAQQVFSKKNVETEQPWYGLEQEYFILDDSIKRKIKIDIKKNKLQQGQYYCSVGSQNTFLRSIVDKHMMACLEAGLNISGTNAEVAPCQWEFQIGPCVGIKAADQLWIARYLLEKISEAEGYYIEWSPKPFNTINGSGCHTNFSTRKMREDGGIKYILNTITKLSLKHKEHMSIYGADNDKRMIGEYETSSYKNFKFDLEKPVNRGASVRIGHDTIIDKKGYFEDRRPASNADPYQVTAAIFATYLE